MTRTDDVVDSSANNKRSELKERPLTSESGRGVMYNDRKYSR